MIDEMASQFVPYGGIRSIEDLLLLREAFDAPPEEITVPKALYPGEALLWLEIEAEVEQLFSPQGETLVVAEAEDGSRGWRLSLTPYGFLCFESGEGEDQLRVESKVPLFSYLREGASFRVGVAVNNACYAARGTGYEKEGATLNRIRLTVAPGPETGLTVCGWNADFFFPDLAAVPRHLRFGDAHAPAFRGRIKGVTLYNTHYVEMFERPDLPSADDVTPPILGGGGFHARWTADDAIDVFGRPEFNGTGSAWAFLKITDPSGRLRRVNLRTLWNRVATMNPSFFISADGDQWERITPSRIDLGDTLYSAELTLTEARARGCYLSGAIPFPPRHREAFLELAKSRWDATITVPGQSVEGRDIPVARIGPEDPNRFHVVIICGQHGPSEIMCAHILRPLLEEAERLDLLSTHVFHLVPTVNVDMAHYGGNGLNAQGRNTNRHWLDGGTPENQAAIRYLEDLREKGCRVGLGVDFHAGGCWRHHTTFYHGKKEDEKLGDDLLKRQRSWQEALEVEAGIRRRESHSVPRGRGYAIERIIDLFHCPAFLIELSLCSHVVPVEQTARPFSQESLDIVGRGLARALARRHAKGCGMDKDATTERKPEQV